jgi:hypothetical protein
MHASAGVTEGLIMAVAFVLVVLLWPLGRLPWLQSGNSPRKKESPRRGGLQSFPNGIGDIVSLIADCDNQVTLRESRSIPIVGRGTEQRMGTLICWATPSHARTANHPTKSSKANADPKRLTTT